MFSRIFYYYECLGYFLYIFGVKKITVMGHDGCELWYIIATYCFSGSIAKETVEVILNHAYNIPLCTYKFPYLNHQYCLMFSLHLV